MERGRLILLLLVQLASHAWCSLSAKSTGNLATANDNGSSGQETVGWLAIFFNPTARLDDWSGCEQTGAYAVVTMINVPKKLVVPICDQLNKDGFDVKDTECYAFNNRWTISGHKSVKTTHSDILTRRSDCNHKNARPEYNTKGYIRAVSEYPRELLEAGPTGK